ncbi:MAG: CapA family protein [Alistipes sp.]|nr:CapA family protein [Alistipes sp.]
MRIFAVVYLLLCCCVSLLCPLTCAVPDASSERGVAACNGKACVEQESRVRLLFMGDIMGHMPQVESARRSDGSYDFSPVFRYVKPLIERADLAVANLETTLAAEPPYSGYPRFRTPASLAAAMRDAGVDVVLTANNHSLDCGAEGVQSTLRELDYYGLMHTGTSGEALHCSPLIVDCQGVSIAILNYTFSTNGIPLPEGVGVNMLDRGLIASDLAECAATDVQVVCLHWGVEYAKVASREQRRIAEWLRAEGVDIVVGTHPHTVQGVECDGRSVTLYSLGNFVSNQRMEGTDEGLMAEVECTIRRNAEGAEVKAETAEKGAEGAEGAAPCESECYCRVNLLPVWVRHRDYAVIPTLLSPKGLMR